MIPELGHFALWIALGVSIILGVMPMVGAQQNRGDWMALARPSAGTGRRRSKGFDVISRNSRKPNESRPITARMRETTLSGRWRLKVATASVQNVSISSHKRIEPSWPPQTAVMR